MAGKPESELEAWLREQMPRNAIRADLSKQAPNNSYSPPYWYEDQPFQCVDCGQKHVWTAKEQQWWYEVAKGSIYRRAKRCAACRKAFNEKTGKLSHAERRAKDEANRAVAAAPPVKGQ